MLEPEKQKIFNQIKELNVFAKESNYKNKDMTPNRMLGILKYMKQHPEKYTNKLQNKSKSNYIKLPSEKDFVELEPIDKEFSEYDTDESTESKFGQGLEYYNKKEESKYTINDLPKSIKEIKNMNQFFRDILEQENDKYWKEMLKDAYTCDNNILNPNETPLKRKREIVQQYLDYKNNNKLTEGIHLYGFVKDKDGNAKVMEDTDYPNKKSYESDLRANGYTVNRVNDNRDMYVLDNSDYRSINEITNKIKQIEKDIKDGIALPSEKLEINTLKDILDKAMKVPLTENKLEEEGKETMNKTDAINKVMKHIEDTLNMGKDDLTIKSQDNGDINVYDKATEKELLVITPQELRKILTESKLVETNNKIVLYHNTTNKNAISISKEGIKGGMRLSAYGKGSEAEGAGIWCSNVRGYGYGGATITFEVDENEQELIKQNNTEYTIYRDIAPEEIIDIDLMISDIPCNMERTDTINSTVESDIPAAIKEIGKDKLLKVFGENPNHFAQPYNLEQLEHLIETGEKYCKGKIQLTESKHKVEEASRNELLVKTKGETISRYNRAKGYKGFHIIGIDTTNILKSNTLTITCKVGKYNNVLELQDILDWVYLYAEQQTNNKYQVNTKVVTQALMDSVDGMDIKIDCECR